MSDPVLSEEELAVWVGALQALFGSMMLLFGLRRRSETSATNARIGALCVIGGMLKLLEDLVPERILVSAAAVAGLLVLAWYIRDRRIERARRPPLPHPAAPTEGHV